MFLIFLAVFLISLFDAKNGQTVWHHDETNFLIMHDFLNSLFQCFFLSLSLSFLHAFSLSLSLSLIFHLFLSVDIADVNSFYIVVIKILTIVIIISTIQAGIYRCVFAYFLCAPHACQSCNIVSSLQCPQNRVKC
ncbi:hypothetical protein PUN28_012332 [Cardiocondyla obscurior]|uniref:Uncharacterized protein n=1 Tax=Cardiocondyla obscurior TaxID=286306 RepID=A0AAW2FD99_9HYME